MEEYQEIQIPGQEQESEGSKLDIGRFLRRIWKFKFFIIAVCIIGTIPFYFQAKNIVPMYQANALIRDKESMEGEGGILTEARITEINSRTFAENVVAQIGYTMRLRGVHKDHSRNQLFAEFYTNKEPVPGLYRLAVDDKNWYRLYLQKGLSQVCIDSAQATQILDSARSINGFTFRLNATNAIPPLVIEFDIKDFGSMVAKFRDKIKVTFSNSRDFMRITMTDTDPEMVTSMVNRLAEVYIQESIGMQTRDSRKRNEALKQQLSAAKQKLDDAEASLRAFKQAFPEGIEGSTRNKISAVSTLESLARDIPATRKGLEELLAKLQEAKNAPEAELTTKYIYSQICNYKDLALDTEVGIIKEQLKDLQTRYDQFVTTYSESHSDAQALKVKINQLYQVVEDRAHNYLTSLNDKERDYQRRIEEFKVALRTLPGEQERQTELEREIEVSEKLYSDLLVKYQKSQISDAVEFKNLDVLEPAQTPKYSVSPGKKNLIVMGLGMSFLFGLLVPIVITLLDQKIYSADDIKKHLKLKVLGVIPNINFRDVQDYQDSEKAKLIDRQLVTHNYTPTPIGEAYRALRTNLMFSKNVGKIRTLVFTSTSPGEGKSFTASNFSIIIAQQRTNTLLVDADLRRGVLHNTFNCQKVPGFSNYLTNTVTLAEVVQETHIPNLSLISCGDLIPNPSELLGSLQMRRFLDEVRRKFDLVVFDSPPLNAATDAIVIGAQSDALAIVVRAGFTNRKQAKMKMEIFDSVPVNLIGVILNGTQLDPMKDSYSYYHY